MSSSYHPQSDGQTEVVNRILEQYLRCFAGDQPRKWFDWVPWAEFSYNTSIHSSTKMTPSEAVYGIPPPSLLKYVPETSNVQAVDELLRDRDSTLSELRRNLLLAQNLKKCQADQHQREVSFAIGDYVYLKLQPYRQSSVAFPRSMKLSPRFYGPYKVIEKVGTMAYKLELPSDSQIHNVFHSSLLRKHLGLITSTIAQLPIVSETGTILPQPESVIDRLVPVEDATWENKWRFTRAYLIFILEDKDC